MKELKAFSYENYSTDRKIVIFGAGLYGELALRALEKWDIPVYGFVDSKYTEGQYMGYPVIRPSQLLDIGKLTVLLASKYYIREMMCLLESNQIFDYFSIELLLQTELDESILSEYAREAYHNTSAYQFVTNNLNSEKLLICNVDLVLTQYCNLRCRDCGSLIPYYKQPRHYDANKIVESFDKFLNVIDGLHELRLLGGETFLYPELIKILNHYKNNSKIDKIVIYTNSTIVPSEEVLHALNDNKVVVHLSDYGCISGEIDRLKYLLNDYGINHVAHEYEEWRDMGNLQRRLYSKEQVSQIFQNCANANCPSFINGKLFICPRAGHGESIGAYENKEDEIVDFNNYEDKHELRKKIRKVLFERDYFEACYYCNGNSARNKSIPAAIQMKRNK